MSTHRSQDCSTCSAEKAARKEALLIAVMSEWLRAELAKLAAQEVAEALKKQAAVENDIWHPLTDGPPDA